MKVMLFMRFSFSVFSFLSLQLYILLVYTITVNSQLYPIPFQFGNGFGFGNGFQSVPHSLMPVPPPMPPVVSFSCALYNKYAQYTAHHD